MLESLKGVILSGEEYQSWRVAVQAAFDGEDLSEHLRVDKPSEMRSNKEKNQWLKKDSLAYVTLFQTLNAEDQNLVQHSSNCFGLLSLLQEKYEATDEFMQSFLVTKLAQIPDRSSSPAKIIIDMMNLKQRFAKESEDSISDKSFILLTMMKLPESFKLFAGPCFNKTSLFTEFDEFARVALDRALALIKVEEDKEINNNRTPPSNKSYYYRRTVPWSLNRKIKCFKCHRIGHIARFCLKIEINEPIPMISISIIALSPGKFQKKHWIILNNASHHATPHKDLLSDYFEFEKTKVDEMRQEAKKCGFEVPSGVGHFVLRQCTTYGHIVEFKMKVYHVPNIICNAFALQQVSDHSSISFKGDYPIIHFLPSNIRVRAVRVSSGSLSALQDESDRY